MTVIDAALGALTVTFDWMALGCEHFQADGGSFIRNRSLPLIRDCNQLTDVTAATEEEIERLLARVEREFEGFPYRQFRVDFRTPPAFEARLVADGYESNEALALVLEGELTGEGPRHDIRPVADEAGWAAYAVLHEIDWQEYREKLAGGLNPAVGHEMVESRRQKSPPVRWWLAYCEGEPRAYLGSWEGNDGFGQIEDLFTHPDYRHRGLATALIRYGVADCRAHGAGPVAIFADTKDTPKNMYRALGFRPLAVSRTYWKSFDSS